MKKININNLQVDERLLSFVNEEAIPGTNINVDNFWSGFDKVVHDLALVNKKLLEKINQIQKEIDQWHLSKKGTSFNKDEYFNFLKSINYIVEEKEDFKITTSNVDKEISAIAGPQLVVPVDNARYALNAANARWGSLYDSLYGTDAISSKNKNQEKAKKVIDYVRDFLDKISPIDQGRWKDISKLKVEEKNLTVIINNKNRHLKNKKQFIGFNGDKNNPKSILLKNNNLHIDIIIDPNNSIGKRWRFEWSVDF